MRPAWLNDFLNRVGGPRAISITAWATLGPIAILGPIPFLPSDLVAQKWPLLLSISLLSYLPSGLLFYVAFKTYLKPTRSVSRPWAAMITFFFGGGSTGILFALLLGLFEVEPDPDHLGRFLTRGLIGLCWSSIIALVLDARYRFVQASDQLKASIAENQALIKERTGIVERVRSEILQMIQHTLAQVLKNPTPSQLNKLADDVIRPLSQAIGARSFVWQAPNDLPIRESGFWPVIRTSLLKPSNALLIPIVVAFIAHLSSVRIIGSFTIINGVLIFASWLATVTLIRALKPKSLGLAVFFWLTGFSLHLLVVLFIQGLFGGAMPPLLGTNPGAWLLALFLNVQATLEVARKESLHELELELQKTEWQRKKLQQEVWVETRTLARYVHGGVQGQIRAAALSSEPLSELELEELRQACLEALEERPGSNDIKTFFEQSHKLWAESLEIRNYLSAAVLAAISSDPFAQEAVIEVIRESLINAVRHGSANWVEITGELNEQPGSRSLALTIKNAGSQLNPDGVAGFGTELMDDATATWSRENWEHGVEVKAIIPIADKGARDSSPEGSLG